LVRRRGAFVFVMLRIFLQNELFKQLPDGKTPEPVGVNELDEGGGGGINSTEPVKGLGDSGCEFFFDS
jgi:hypothetical protein